LKSGPKSYEHLKLKRQVPEERKSIGGVEVKEMEVKRYTWVVGEKRRKEKEIKNKKVMYLVVGKKRKKKENNNNNNNIIIIKSKSKNQNYVPNTIFFLNCDFSCETKTMYQTEFFLQS
jgi:hypothetical protein